MDSIEIDLKSNNTANTVSSTADGADEASNQSMGHASFNARATSEYLNVMSRHKSLLSESSGRTFNQLTSSLNSYLLNGTSDIEYDADSAVIGHYRKLTVQVINRDPNLQEKIASNLSTSKELIRSKDAAGVLEQNLKALPEALNEGSQAGKALGKFICQSVVNLTDYKNMGAGLQRDLAIRDVYAPDEELSVRSKMATAEALSASIAYVKSNQEEVLKTLPEKQEVESRKTGTTTPQIMTRYLRQALNEFPEDSTYLDIFKKNRSAAEEEQNADEVSKETARRIKELIAKAAQSARRSNLIPSNDGESVKTTAKADTTEAKATSDSQEKVDGSKLSLSELSARAAKLQKQFREERMRLASEGKLPDPATRTPPLDSEDPTASVKENRTESSISAPALNSDEIKKLALEAVKEALKESDEKHLEERANSLRQVARDVVNELKTSLLAELEQSSASAKDAVKAVSDLKETMQAQLNESRNTAMAATEAVFELQKDVEQKLAAQEKQVAEANRENVSKEPVKTYQSIFANTSLSDSGINISYSATVRDGYGAYGKIPGLTFMKTYTALAKNTNEGVNSLEEQESLDKVENARIEYEKSLAKDTTEDTSYESADVKTETLAKTQAISTSDTEESPVKTDGRQTESLKAEIKPTDIKQADSVKAEINKTEILKTELYSQVAEPSEDIAVLEETEDLKSAAIKTSVPESDADTEDTNTDEASAKTLAPADDESLETEETEDGDLQQSSATDDAVPSDTDENAAVITDPKVNSTTDTVNENSPALNMSSSTAEASESDSDNQNVSSLADVSANRIVSVSDDSPIFTDDVSADDTPIDFNFKKLYQQSLNSLVADDGEVFENADPKNNTAAISQSVTEDVSDLDESALKTPESALKQQAIKTDSVAFNTADQEILDDGDVTSPNSQKSNTNAVLQEDDYTDQDTEITPSKNPENKVAEKTVANSAGPSASVSATADEYDVFNQVEDTSSADEKLLAATKNRPAILSSDSMSATVSDKTSSTLGTRILADTVPYNELEDSVVPSDVKQSANKVSVAEFEDDDDQVITAIPTRTPGAAAITSGGSEPVPQQSVVENDKTIKESSSLFSKIASLFGGKKETAVQTADTPKAPVAELSSLLAMCPKGSPLDNFMFSLGQCISNPALPQRVRDDARKLLERLKDPVDDLPSVSDWLNFVQGPMSPSSSLALGLHQWAFMLLSIRFAQLGKSVDKFLSKNFDAENTSFDSEVEEILSKTDPKTSKRAFTSLCDDTLSQITRLQNPHKENLPLIFQYIPLAPEFDDGREGGFNLKKVIEEDGSKSWHLDFVFDIKDVGPVEIKAVAKLPELKLTVIASTFEGLKKVQELMPVLKKQLQDIGVTTTNTQARLGKVQIHEKVVRHDNNPGVLTTDNIFSAEA